jgi:hypothetical protein
VGNANLQTSGTVKEKIELDGKKPRHGNRVPPKNVNIRDPTHQR